VVVSKELREALEDDDAYEWSSVGKKRLKGIKGQPELYRVRRAGAKEDD
jgi:class 3 adenylate cyclase